MICYAFMFVCMIIGIETLMIFRILVFQFFSGF